MKVRTTLNHLFAILILITILPVPFARAAVSRDNEALDAQVKTTCALSRGTGKIYGYCINKIVGSTNTTDVIYYLHGQGGSEYDWMRSRAMANFYRAWGTNAPAVIAISYGPTWALAEKNASKLSGLFEHFVDKVMPEVEGKVGYAISKRTVVGASMGGFNASQLYLKRPALFSKAALLCPIITPVGPYSAEQDIRDYILRTHASSAYVRRALYFVKLFFADDAAWNLSAPLTLANTMITPASPALYVSAGDKDQYGIAEGSKSFADLAQSKGAQSEQSTVAGYHCSFDQVGLEAFLKK